MSKHCKSNLQANFAKKRVRNGVIEKSFFCPSSCLIHGTAVTISMTLGILGDLWKSFRVKLMKFLLNVIRLRYVIHYDLLLSLDVGFTW